ncbi:hypothetical protein [Hyalangium sp.]|uniref:hypothetical protein n=1 Tax=Hyalangium sp. TaxID=2028555 RepID=UPI002D53EC4A|nr:hypothetical protein [Hyalangium sp.]HYI02527.1 hypothetical protein [Hyalangium sp.]
MKLRMPVTFFFMLSLLVAGSASAQASVYNLTVPSTITDPLAGFTINYSLGGSKWGVGAASAELRFYISASPNGSTGVATLAGWQIHLSGSGWGPYYPPSGNQSLYVSRWNMPANTVALLESISAACAPQTWYILAELDWTGYKNGPTLMGTTKQPDLYFSSGTISPAAIRPGGTTNISFDVTTRCPTSSGSRVGIYLADANYQLLSFIGAVSIGSGAGTWSLPPTGITFSPYIATGTYNIVLFADMDGYVAESNENNNAGAFQLGINWNAMAAAGSEEGKLELQIQPPFESGAALYNLKSSAPDNYVQEFHYDAEL